ncbi:LpxI family protein [Vannielia litorea]|uniref:LpxI family protein n=1 Tax=Vannielia litorea TaxID=1217970 RepID=UPI001C96F325|nr:UDP-2,3-diacylglucosamine diphosphatase LpxI [Vannielia litorea]MBY6047382.1 UDP-2,3-diacylglucosamine diphosphatase LpxI [Vannielia litorea]MBY6074796.1 UDP-2,3-diacylglucosamine diphosphatase LpxI [Vannielia litorea]
MLALIAGQGLLPSRLVAALERVGRDYRLYALEGFEPEVGDRPVTRFRLEELGSFIAGLVEGGCEAVCLAGAVKRPRIDRARVDPATHGLIVRLAGAMERGDDGTLREIMAIFEEAGLRVEAAHEIAPELLPASGVLTGATPGPGDHADATRAESVVAAMGAADVGQACVVASGQVLAVEAAGGTDWMIRSLMRVPEAVRREEQELLKGATLFERASEWVADVKEFLTASEPSRLPERDKALPEGGLLYKAPKPGQDRRADLPVIGPATVMLAAEAELRGIVVEAGGVMVLDLETVVAMADAVGLFIWVRPKEAQ